jgi:YEATS domain-containing protein 4
MSKTTNLLTLEFLGGVALCGESTTRTFPILWRKSPSPSTTLSKIQLSVSHLYITSVAIDKFPFETHQSGWGEFEIGIRIFFKDPNEKPIDALHFLKLHTDSSNQNNSTKKPVVSERYDEIVFQSPTESFYQLL